MRRSPHRRFAYRLAVQIGIVNVQRDILEGLTARQFQEWQLYSEIEPFGELRDDYRAASIRETVFNVAVSKEYRRPLKDFLLQFGEAEEKPRKTWQQMKKIAEWIALAYSGPAKDV